MTLFQSHGSAQGWFDPGPIDAQEFDRLLEWFGLEDDASTALRTLHRDLLARLDSDPGLSLQGAVPGAAPLRSGWHFDEHGYRYDSAVGDRIVAVSTLREATLLRLEDELWSAAIDLAGDEASKRRVRLVAVAREMQLRTHALSMATAATRLEHRGEVLLPAAIAGTMLRDFLESRTDGGEQASRRREQTLLESLDGAWDPLLDAVRERHAGAAPFARDLARYRDRAMWDSSAMGSAVDQALRSLRNADGPLRAAVIEAQDAAIRDLRRRSPADDPAAAGSIRAWEASAFPAVHGEDPRVAARLEADARRSTRIAAELLELAAWHRERDAALAAEAVELCTTGGAAVADPSEVAVLAERLRRIETARAELADRAEIRRRLSCRDAGEGSD